MSEPKGPIIYTPKEMRADFNAIRDKMAKEDQVSPDKRNEAIFKEIKGGNFDNVHFLTKINHDICRILSERKENPIPAINFSSLEVLPDDCVQFFANYKGAIHFLVLKSLSLRAAQSLLSINQGRLSFQGLAHLDKEVIMLLAKYEKEHGIDLLIRDLEVRIQIKNAKKRSRKENIIFYIVCLNIFYDKN